MDLIPTLIPALIGVAAAVAAALWRSALGAGIGLGACGAAVAAVAAGSDPLVAAAVLFVQATLGLAVLLAAAGQKERASRGPVLAAAVTIPTLAVVLWMALHPAGTAITGESPVATSAAGILVLAIAGLGLLAAVVGISAISGQRDSDGR